MTMADEATSGALGTEPPTLSTFWIGPRLPDFQNMCLRSWLAMGHPVQFFSYDPVANVPEGVRVRDAEEVFPRAELDDPARDVHVVIKSDIWRWAMFQKQEGIWVDSDVVLVRPIPQPRRLLLGREERGVPCIAVMWWPHDHPAVTHLLDVFHRNGLGIWAYAKPRWKRFQNLVLGRPNSFHDYPWNHWGRHAVEFFLLRYGLKKEVLGYKSFYWPVVYDDYLFQNNPFQHILDDPEVLGLHCFRKSDDWFHAAPEGSFMHWAKRQYL